MFEFNSFYHHCPLCDNYIDDGDMVFGFCFDCLDKYEKYSQLPVYNLDYDGFLFMARYHQHKSNVYAKIFRKLLP